MEVLINGKQYIPLVEFDSSKKSALDVRIKESDAGDNISVRDYLYRLLCDLWIKEDSFNSKRPFGNSGWRHEVIGALAREGFIDANIDEDGYVDMTEEQENAAVLFVHNLIKAVFFDTLAE